MTKVKLFIGIVAVLLYGPTRCQSITYPVGAGPVASGQSSTVRLDFWSVYNNQAAAAYITRPQAGIFTENRFLLNDLNRVTLGLAVPLKQVVLVASLDHFGGQMFSEMKAGFGCAIQLGKHFSAGMQLDYLGMRPGKEYGACHAISFEAGIYSSITDKLSMGVHMFNPIQAKWIYTKEPLPSCIRAGLGFKPDPSLQLFMELNKSPHRQTILCAGAEYSYREKVTFRAGLTTGTVQYTFGAGIKLKKLRIDLSSSIHAWLGYSPQISFIYLFRQ